MKILIIRVDHLGDLILTTPLMRALDLAGHAVNVVARRESLPVLAGNPHIAMTRALEDISPDFPKRWWKLSEWVHEHRPDIVLIPHARPTWLLIALRLGFLGKIVTMWGSAAARMLACDTIRSGLPTNPRHMSDICLDLARKLSVEPRGLDLEIFLRDDEMNAAEHEIRTRFSGGEFIAVHPGCSGNTCNLPPTDYAKLIERGLETTNACFIITGSTEERTKFESIFAKFTAEARVWNSMGDLDLRQLCAVLASARALVCVGTGPLHIASALKIPTVSPFCNRVGVSSKVWGNLGGQSSELTPPPRHCQAPRRSVHCDFSGAITSQDILDALIHVTRGS